MNSTPTQSINLHHTVFMIEQWRSFIQGVDRIVGFCRNKNNQETEGFEWSNNNQALQIKSLAIAPDFDTELKVICDSKVNYQWLRPDLLPYESNSRANIGSQLNLFSEREYVVLMVKCTSEDYADVYYLYFRNDQSNFGISDKTTHLETSHKAMIGQMAHQFANITLNNYFNQRQANTRFKERTRLLLEQRVNEESNQEEQILKWKNDWVDDYLFELGERNGFNYVISETARKRVIEETNSFSDTKKILKETLIYICELYEPSLGDTVEINNSNLIVHASEPKPKEETTAIVPNTRINKTIIFLDNLEKVVLNLINNGHNVTSAEVGANMDKPITAPAITDALNKNKARIYQLFDQYPRRWAMIRQHFKPVVNLTTKKRSSLSISS